MRPIPVMVMAALAVSALMPAPVRAQTWREVKTDNFTVLSSASDRRTRSIAWQLEQMRSALSEGLPWVRLALDRPIQVIAVDGEDAMRRMAPEYWERRGGTRPTSVFVTGPDRHYILLRADVQVEGQGMNPHNQAYWAYSALVLRQSLDGRLPLWLVRGLAGVLSNTIIGRDQVDFGKPMPWMARTAKEGPRLPLAELFAVDMTSPYYQGAITRERFDAQSWALVQYLIFGHKDNAGARFDGLLERLAAGTEPEAAAAQVYGSLAALEEAFLLYVSQGVYSYGRLPINRALVEEQLQVTRVEAAEQNAARAAFHAAMQRPEEARVLIAEARKAGATAQADEAEALLLEREQPDAARELYERAAAAGSDSFWTYYRLAAARIPEITETNDFAQVASWLTRATALNPAFTPAFSMLATVQARLGRLEEAIAAASRAVELEHANVRSYVQLARLLASANRQAEAADVARRALPYASTSEERTMLEQLLAGS